MTTTQIKAACRVTAIARYPGARFRTPGRNQGAKFTDAPASAAGDSNSARDDELGAAGLQKCSRGMRALSVFPCSYHYEQREHGEPRAEAAAAKALAGAGDGLDRLPNIRARRMFEIFAL